MRWYRIIAGGQTWDATGDPFALNVEIDVSVTSLHLADSGSFVRVWGIPLQTILTANQFLQQDIDVYAGMQQPGLPLADPSQQGLLVHGGIFPAFGNWVGTDMTLDFIISPPLGGSSQPYANNVVHNLQPGQPFSSGIQLTLATAAPGYTPVINISPSLVQNFPDVGPYQNVSQWVQYIYLRSREIMGNVAGYLGVHMFAFGKQMIVTDFTQPASNTTQINFQDLIGQPIWTGLKKVQFKTVMRGDLIPGQHVILPPALATITAASGATVQGSPSASNVIQGTFKILDLHHVGNFRQPDWPSWCTIVNAQTA